MASLDRARIICLCGIAASAIGVSLNMSLDWIQSKKSDIDLLNFVALLSIALTLPGLVAALIGAALWAWKSAPIWSCSLGISLAVAVVITSRIVDMNVHGPTAILGPVLFAGVVASGLMLLIALVRALSSRKGPER